MSRSRVFSCKEPGVDGLIGTVSVLYRKPRRLVFRIVSL
jgi:hypothetical protein